MDQYNSALMGTEYAERMERMYPDTAVMMMPYVRELIDAMDDDTLDDLTQHDIARMTDDAMKRSGMAVNMPAGHSSDTLNDLTRSLVVREVIDRGRGRRNFPFFFPFYFFPFDGRGHFRDYGRFDRNHRGRRRDYDFYDRGFR